jgi:predicted transcriptional regulator
MDDMLRLLEDGKWHDMREIIYNSRLHDPEVETFMGFLSEYDFIELDKSRQKVKLTPSLYKFVRKIKLIEEKEAVRESEVP